MAWTDRFAATVTGHAWTVILVLMLTTAALGTGMTAIEEPSSVSGLSGDSDVAEAQDRVQNDFSTRDANTTTMVIAVQAEDGNALSRDSLLRSLRYQRALRSNETVNRTLGDEQPTGGVANVVAMAAMGDRLETRTDRLKDALDHIYVLQLAYDRWNLSHERGRVGAETYQTRTGEIERSLVSIRANATANLSEAQASRFNQSADRVRLLTHERTLVRTQYRRGEVDEETYRERTDEIENQTATAYRDGTQGVFEDQFDTLQNSNEQPPIDDQIAGLERPDEATYDRILTDLVDPESDTRATNAIYRQLPQAYEPGSTTADARLLVVTYQTHGTVRASVAISEEVTSGQAAARSLAKAQSGPESYAVVSRGLIGLQQQKAVDDSLAILGPLALLFILLSLSVAYRDLGDVLLGLAGVGVVFVWTFGAMGWLGIPFGQTMIAAPILLIGLSVDYAFHVVMRYREERSVSGAGSAGTDTEVRTAMARSLLGVVPALALVTMTTAVGFLANLASPLGSIQNFGIVTAVGIAATLVVFTVFMPALKTVISSFLAGRGWDSTPSPPGASRLVDGALGVGARAATRAPLAVLLVAVLLSAGGAYGATQVDVSASQELFMADDPPEWTESLPEDIQPGEFYLKENRRFVFATFQSPDQQGYVLVEGNVTAPGTLDRVDQAERGASNSKAVFVAADGTPAVQTPLSAMRDTTTENESFNATFQTADADGDGVPDERLETVYDEFYAAAPDRAARTLHRTQDGEYTALRLRIAIAGDSGQDATAAVLTDATGEFDGQDSVKATATGTPLIEQENTDRVARSMVEGLVVTLVVVLVLLAIVFRVRERSATLGLLTLVPVAFTVTWLLGTMALLEFSISPVTSLVGSISIGLGVDYAIHVSERFAQERRAGARTAATLRRTVTGTGSAMLSSAVTTAAGFGVLSFALLPGLRQFGIVLAVGIIYAFLATVYVQPSLLVLWTRYGTDELPAARPDVASGDD